MARAYIGTSGWSYDHWRNGVFYPPGLPPSKWLAFHAEHFDTVELNASFYRWPRDSSVVTWGETVPDGFRFAVKLWRGFTHYSRLEDPKDNLARFLAIFDGMPVEKRGPLLLQLPPQMEVDALRLDRFLAKLTAAAEGWQVCVEFRNATWLEPGIVAILDKHRVALCVHDMVWAAPVSEPNQRVPFVYVRRHGPNSRYGGTYSDERIAADAAAIRGWLAEGRDVYVYFNNDGKGYAVRDALRLKQALLDGREAAPAPRAAAPARRPRRPARKPPLEEQPRKWARPRRAPARPPTRTPAKPKAPGKSARREGGVLRGARRAGRAQGGRAAEPPARAR